MKKKVLITGISGGIGAALASILIKRNYEVIGIDIKKPSNPDIIFYKCDLSNICEIEAFTNNEVPLWINELESIIHLAGVYPNKNLIDYSSELWDTVHTVNVKSIFILVKNIIKLNAPWLESIVLVSSTASISGSNDPAYTSSKSALNGLSKNLSLSLAKYNIRVNTVLPGIIDTPMSEVQSNERKDFHVSNTLAKYIGKPEEVANVIDFLVSKKASYLWGSSISVNGGMTL